MVAIVPDERRGEPRAASPVLPDAQPSLFTHRGAPSALNAMFFAATKEDG